MSNAAKIILVAPAPKLSQHLFTNGERASIMEENEGG